MCLGSLAGLAGIYSSLVNHTFYSVGGSSCSFGSFLYIYIDIVSSAEEGVILLTVLIAIQGREASPLESYPQKRCTCR